MIKKKSTIKKMRRCMALLLALVIAFFAVYSDCVYDVLAKNQDVSITTEGNMVLFEFSTPCFIEGLDQKMDLENDKGLTVLNQIIEIEGIDVIDASTVSMNAVHLEIVWDNDFLTSIGITLEEGWLLPEHIVFGADGSCIKKLSLKNDAFHLGGATGPALSGVYEVQAQLIQPLKNNVYESTGVSTELYCSRDAVYFISVLPSEKGIVSGGSCLLTKTGDECELNFMPNDNCEINKLIVNGQNILELEPEIRDKAYSVALGADGSYSLTFQYDSLHNQGGRQKYSIQAEYDWKKTQFKSDIVVEDTQGTLYCDKEYQCFVQADIFRPDASIEWFCYQTDGQLYEGADIIENAAFALSGDAISALLKLNDKAKDGEKFTVIAKPTDTDEVSGKSIELTVSIPEITDEDYQYESENGERLPLESEWYAQTVVLKPGAAVSKWAIELKGQEGQYYDHYLLEKSVSKQDNLWFRLVALGGDEEGKKSEWKQIEIQIDKDCPSINQAVTSLNEGEWGNQETEVTVTVSDIGSGVAAVKYTTDASVQICTDVSVVNAKEAVKNDIDQYCFQTKKEDGEKPIYFIWTVDQAGNYSEITGVSVNVEYTAPQIISVENPSDNQNWTNSGHEIIVTAEDKEEGNGVRSGLSCLKYKAEDGQVHVITEAAVSGAAFQYVIQLENKSNISLYEIWACDKAGNESEVTTTSVSIDCDQPKITEIKFLPLQGGDWAPLNTAFGHFLGNTVQVLVTIEKDKQLTDIEQVILQYEENGICLNVQPVQLIDKNEDQEKKVYQAVFELKPEGFYKNIHIQAVDQVGNVETTSYAQLLKESSPDSDVNSDVNHVLIEKTPPQIQFHLDEINGDGIFRDPKTGQIWSSKAISFTAELSDFGNAFPGSGIYKYVKSMNGVITETLIIANQMMGNGQTDKQFPINISTTDTSEQLPAKLVDPINDFEYQITIEAIDKCQNKSVTSCSVYVDTAMPEIKSIHASAVGWTKENKVIISGKADDAGSGVQQVLYAFIAKEADEISAEELVRLQQQAASAQLDQDNHYTITAEEEQEGTYCIWAVDQVGNVSEVKKQSVKIDLTAPRIDQVSTSLKEGAWSNKDEEVTIIASDINSGVTTVKYTTDASVQTDTDISSVNAKEAKKNENDQYCFMTKKEDGAKPTYFIWTVDAAGNCSEVMNVSVNVEYTSPQISAVENPSANQHWTNNGHEIIVTVEDKDDGNGVRSGLACLKYRADNGQDIVITEAVMSGDLYQYVIHLENKSNISAYDIWVCDNAGNESEVTTTSVSVDCKQPIITNIEFLPDNGWDSLPDKKWEPLNTTFGHFLGNTVQVLVTMEKDRQLSDIEKVIFQYEKNGTLMRAPAIQLMSKTADQEKKVYQAVYKLNPVGFYKNIQVTAFDQAGNAVTTTYAQLLKESNPNSSVNSEVNNVLIEKTPPQIQFQLDEINGDGIFRDPKSGKIWSSKDVSFTADISDVGSALSGSGIYKYVKSMNGVVTETLTIAAQMMGNGQTDKQFSVKISTTDAPEQFPNSFVSPINDFEYQITVEAIDKCQNKSMASCSVYIDMAMPEIKSVNASAVGWTKENKVIISGKADDAGSGVHRVIYAFIAKDADQISDEELLRLQKQALTAQLDQSNHYTFTAEGEQEGTYCIWAVDQVGNVSEVKKQSVKIDLTAPRIGEAKLSARSLKCGNFSNQSVRLEVPVEDGALTSGIHSVTLMDGENVVSEAVLENGAYVCALEPTCVYQSLHILAKDAVGNETDKAINEDNALIISQLLLLEKSAPLLTINVSPAAVEKEGILWFGDDMDFVIDVSETASKLESGIYLVTATLNDREIMRISYADEETALYEARYACSTKTVGIPTDGKYLLKVFVEDNAGNTVEKQLTVFIDRDAPQITGIRILDKTTGQELDDVNNYLSYGNFYNEDVYLEVTYFDEAPSSGIDRQEIKLYAGDSAFIPLKIEETETVDGKAVKKAYFDINSPFLQNDLQIEIKDCTKHSSQKQSIRQFNQSIQNNDLMLENQAPKIEITVPEPDYIKNNQGSEEYWYRQNIDFTMHVEDVDAGLRSFHAEINGSNLIAQTENDRQLKDAVYYVNTGEQSVDRGADGSFQLQVSSVDNAGNSAGNARIVYTDTDSPKVIGYRFEPVGNSEGQNVPVETADYGYYFKDAVKVIVTAEDLQPSSGLARIDYRMVNIDGTELKGTQDCVNNQIVLDIPEGFKGKIYTTAVDCVGNMGEEQSVEGIVQESPTLHAMTSSVRLTKPESERKDAKGLDLYQTSVPVAFHVEDQQSGIRSIEWSVIGAGDADCNQSGRLEINNSGELLNDAGWNVIASNNNLRTIVEKSIVVQNNCNDIVVSLILTDRAGNQSYQSIEFSIDLTAPRIDVSYSNNIDDADYNGYFKEGRIANLTVTERNFQPENVDIKVTNSENIMPTYSEWTHSAGSGNGDDATHTMSIVYDADGDYAFDVQYTDMAGNSSAGVSYGDSAAPIQFTIDGTLPEIELTYDNANASGKNQYYYQEERTGTIRIKEHNFDESRVVVDIKAMDNHGAETTAPVLGRWQETAEDVREATVTFQDGYNYSIAVQYTDMAGNQATAIEEQRFCVDTQDPEVSVKINYGTQGALSEQKLDVFDETNWFACSQEEIQLVVEFRDVNLDENQTGVELVAASQGAVNVEKTEQVSEDNNDRIKTITFANLQTDDIYTLTVSATDEAVRVCTPKKYRFSVNRDGSTYEFVNKNKFENIYIQTPEAVVVREINVDPVSQDSVEVILSKDELKNRNLKENQDYSVEKNGEVGKWREYIYTIFESNFSQDGLYKISLSSLDKAMNVSKNTSKAHEDDGDKKAEIAFYVDQTEPNVSVLNIENDETYPLDSMEANISVNDNSYVNEIQILLNEELKASYHADEIKAKREKGEEYQITIANSNEAQTMQVIAFDAAGNRKEIKVENFFVTTNPWIRFINNKTALYSVITGGSLFIAAGIVFVFVRKRKVYE